MNLYSYAVPSHFSFSLILTNSSFLALFSSLSYAALWPPTLVSPQLQSGFFFLTFIIVVSCSALPFGVTTETLATQDPEAEDEETDTPIYEKYDAMLHGKRKDRK